MLSGAAVPFCFASSGRQNKNNICFFVSPIEKDSIQDKKNRVFGLNQSIGGTKKTVK